MVCQKQKIYKYSKDSNTDDNVVIYKRQKISFILVILLVVTIKNEYTWVKKQTDKIR
jgi:hypothetical protein